MIGNQYHATVQHYIYNICELDIIQYNIHMRFGYNTIFTIRTSWIQYNIYNIFEFASLYGIAHRATKLSHNSQFHLL